MGLTNWNPMIVTPEEAARLSERLDKGIEDLVRIANETVDEVLELREENEYLRENLGKALLTIERLQGEEGDTPHD